MKKVFFLMTAIALCYSSSMKGQEQVGTFSVIPKLGVSIANMSGNAIFYDNSELPVKGKYNARFLGGVEAEYQMLPTTSVSLGVGYVQQGCHFPDFETSSFNGVADDVSQISNKLDYIQCPLTVNQYIAEGLAVRAGVQLGFLVKSEFSYSMTPIKIHDGGKEYGETKDYDYDEKDIRRSLDVSIPVGLSYEYLNVVLDARYHFGLSNLYKDSSWPTEKNKVFTFTVGYKFSL